MVHAGMKCTKRPPQILTAGKCMVNANGAVVDLTSTKTGCFVAACRHVASKKSSTRHHCGQGSARIATALASKTQDARVANRLNGCEDCAFGHLAAVDCWVFLHLTSQQPSAHGLPFPLWDK